MARGAAEEREQERQEAKLELRELAWRIAKDSNRRGTIVEDIIAPSLRRMIGNEFDCGDLVLFAGLIEKRHPLTRQRHNFEALAVGEKAVLANETRTTTRPEWVKEAVEFLQSGQFFEYFPEYTGKRLIPVFSSLYIPEDILAYLTMQNIYAVAMGDETMQVLNLEQVRAQRGD